MHRFAKFGWLLATVTVAAPALAAEPASAPAGSTPVAEAKETAGEEPFGKAGVINVGTDLQLNFQHTGYSSVEGAPSTSSTTYMFGPAADYFVIDNLSVGAAFAIGRVSPEIGVKDDVIAFEPRVGYHIPLVVERLGLWPKASFFYEQRKRTAEGIAASRTEKALGIGIFLPVLIHPVEHFHFGFGPYFQTALSAKEEGENAPKATTLGLKLEISGWWKL